MKVIFLNGDDATSPFRQEFSRQLAGTHTDCLILAAFGFGAVANLVGDRQPNPQLLVCAVKDHVSIGPWYVAGQSVCFSCLAHWLRTTGASRRNPAAPGQGEARLAADWILQHAAAVIAGASLRHTMQTCDLSVKQWFIHPIYPLRNCKNCGAIDIPEWRHLRAHCGSLTGIVQTMQITRTPSAGAYRATATWVSPLPANGSRPLLGVQESHGRGFSRDEAEQGCIGEALERYSLIFRGDEPLERRRISDVSGVDPREILLYSDRQYCDRLEWNLNADERYFVGERFDASQPIDWFPAIDLISGSQAYVPAACTLMWYMFRDGEPEFARADTIGCGSGWTFDDALAHALLEWIERDAMAIWWYNRAHRPAVDLASVDTPGLRMVREGLRRIDRTLVLLDCTTDIGVPVYVAVSPRSDGTEPLFAGASHTSPSVAAWKAASEVGQLWFTMMHKRGIDAEMKSWLTNTTRSQPYLQPVYSVPADDEPAQMVASEQVRLIVGKLKAAGLHPYAADLSRPDVTLRTVRAIVPGLRHIWNRRAPGRLYEVPVRLGWIKAPLDESQLNPICCMI